MDARSIRDINWMAAACLCGLLLGGCGKSSGFSADAARLEKAFALTFSSPQAGDPSTYKTTDTATLAKSLAVALRTGDLDTAAQVLHVVSTRGGGLSFDQYDTLRRTLADVGGQLSRQAANGDTHAKSLLKQMGP